MLTKGEFSFESNEPRRIDSINGSGCSVYLAKHVDRVQMDATPKWIINVSTTLPLLQRFATRSFNVETFSMFELRIGQSAPLEWANLVTWSIFTPVSHLDVLRRFPSNSLPFIHSRLLLEQYWTLYNWIFCPIMSRAKLIFHRKILLFFRYDSSRRT